MSTDSALMTAAQTLYQYGHQHGWSGFAKSWEDFKSNDPIGLEEFLAIVASVRGGVAQGATTDAEHFDQILKDEAVRLRKRADELDPPAEGAQSELMEDIVESGTAEAFDEADFAILYREIPEANTTTLQEITNVPQAFCREIARRLRSLSPAASAEIHPQRGEFLVIDDMQKRRPAIDVAREIIKAGDKYGSAAKHSTTILTRQVLDQLVKQIDSSRQSPAETAAPQEPTEAMNLIKNRLDDLRSANDVLQKESALGSRDRSNDIRRNDREIRWLVDINTVLRSSSQPAASAEQVIRLTYTNHRGETSERTIIPRSIRFGSTEWHREPQWLLLAFDASKNADREFALKDFGSRSQPDIVSENELRETIRGVSIECGEASDVIAKSELAAIAAALLSKYNVVRK